MLSINRLQDLDQLPLVIMLYHSGSSGEFLADALCQSLDYFSRPQSSWENGWRVKFPEILGRSLSRGEIPPGSYILEQTNSYLKQHAQGHHLVMMHPGSHTQEFAETNMPNRPAIVITAETFFSRKFMTLAAIHKINHPAEHELLLRYSKIWEPFSAPNWSRPSLILEWENLMIKHPQKCFLEILDFLRCDGDWSMFSRLLDDYLHRNRELLAQAQDPAPGLVV